MATFTLDETAEKIGKSKQTVRAYIKRRILKGVFEEQSLRVTEESINALPEKLAEATKALYKKRSQNMKEKWRLIKA